MLQGFAAPTPIQEACLMPAIRGRRDIIGAAQTVKIWLPPFMRLAARAADLKAMLASIAVARHAHVYCPEQF